MDSWFIIFSSRPMNDHAVDTEMDTHLGNQWLCIAVYYDCTLTTSLVSMEVI